MLPLHQKIPVINDPEEYFFENFEKKGENAGNQHFLLFPQSFLPFHGRIISVGLCCIFRIKMLSFSGSPKFGFW